MNATLLKSNEANDEQIKRELFGNFKGFSLKPLPMTKPSIVGASNVAYVHPVAKTELPDESNKPCRAAPLPPMNSPKKSQVNSSPKSSPSSFRYQNINAIPKQTPVTPIEVKLFASKSDAKERPKISHPVLENSTCSVKELIATNNSNQKPQKSSIELPKNIPVVNTAQKSITGSQSTLNRALIDKNSIKKLEISAPIKAVPFGRSQSMRSPTSEKGPVKRNGLASGSMRRVDRPKNPPPPRPPNLPDSSASSSLQNVYANMNENGGSSNSIENSTDNIYCVIEEVKEPSPPNGLLSEIVNEIENRNVNSIYSTSKNQRKNAFANVENEQTYENVGQNEKPPLPTNNEIKAPKSNSIYMNTFSADQPLLSNKGKDRGNKTQTSNVSSIAKKLSTVVVPGNSKPVIATKPGVSNLGASNKDTSQNDSTKKPYATRATTSNATKTNSNKATINPTSSIRAMHKRFEMK